MLKRYIWIFFPVLVILVRAKTNDENQYRTAYACEGTKLELQCDNGYLIHLVRANYGRFSISICNEHGNLEWSVDCASIRSYFVIHERCGSKRRCTIPASSSYFDDPCPGTLKYLEAHYQCIPESSSSSTLPSTSSSTSTTTTTRPPIIIPVTRFLKPHQVPSSSPTISYFNTSSLISLTTMTTVSPPTTIILPTSQTNTLRTTLTDHPITSSSPPPVSGYRVTYTASSHSESQQDPDSYCLPSTARNQLWNWTQNGVEVIQKCPSGSTGVSRWRCDNTRPAKWTPSNPDLSDCTSVWLDNLTNRFLAGYSVTNTASEIISYTKSKPMYGGDILQIIQLLHNMVSKMAENIHELEDETRQRILLEEFLEYTLTIHNQLLEFPQKSFWKDLPRPELRKASSALLRGIERSAWLVAAHQRSNYHFNKVLPSTVVSVQVLEMWQLSEIQFPNTNDDEWSMIEDALILPSHSIIETASNGLVKLVLTVFKNMDKFLDPDMLENESSVNNSSAYVLNSRILGVWVDGFHMIRLRAPLTVIFQHLQVENMSNPQCVYWDLNVRSWRTQGCWLRKSNRTHSVCECQLLTNFALIMEITPKQELFPETSVLRIVTIIGSVICLIFITITLIVLQIYRFIKSDRISIHKHFCFCLLISEAIFACGIDQTQYTVSCSILAGFLHYFLLATFMWIFVICLQLHIMFGEILDSEKAKIRWFCALAYGLPLVIIIISSLIDLEIFVNPKYCWIRMDGYYIFSIIVPTIILILASFVLLIMTLCRICYQEGVKKSKDLTKLTGLKIWSVETITVLVVFVLTWSFAAIYLQQGSNISAYLFTLFNALLGFIIFTFYCLKNEKVGRAFHMSLRSLEWLPSCMKSPQTRDSSQSQLYNTGNAPPLASAPSLHSNVPENWGTLKTTKPFLPTVSGTQVRNPPSDHLSIAMLSGYNREEHPLHSLGLSPSSRSRASLHWDRVRVPSPRVHNADHIYESIEENQYISRNIQQNNLSGHKDTQTLGGHGQRAPIASAQHCNTLDIVRKPPCERNIFTAVLTGSPRSFHIPIFREPCQGVAYNGMLSGTDSDSSVTDNRQTPEEGHSQPTSLRTGDKHLMFPHDLKYSGDMLAKI